MFRQVLRSSFSSASSFHPPPFSRPLPYRPLVAAPNPPYLTAGGHRLPRQTQLNSTPIQRLPSYRCFHVTHRRQGAPLIALLAPIFKASAAIEMTKMISRIALTFLPAAIIGRSKSARVMKYAHIHGVPLSDEKREKYMKRLKRSTRLVQIIMFIPFAIFWITILASLEQTPLTGRWRTILLSPEEEDEIAAQLVGQGWYNAVNQVLTEDGEPRFVPPSDWRYQWVRDTLERLVTVLPVLADEHNQAPNWMDVGPEDPPLPPPATFPLRPRPRGADLLRSLCRNFGLRTSRPSDHEDSFSLLLVDSPSDSNAFSYGFWPDGGSGVVVYSGFLDDIFKKIPLQYITPSDDRPWLSKLFNATPPPQPQPMITEDQTADLAVLLAHELSHLILAHHLESLSAATVVVPGTLSILADVVRVLIFPVTMFFGPFVNDAVARLGDIGSGELKRLGEWCTTAKQEVEADVVSARILAYAGFDARHAINFWEARKDNEAECHPVEKDKTRDYNIHGITGTGHPANSKRVEILRQEIARWEEERLAAKGAR